MGKNKIAISFKSINLNIPTKETKEFIDFENSYLNQFKAISNDPKYKVMIGSIIFNQINSSTNNPKEQYTYQSFLKYWSSLSDEFKNTKKYLTSDEMKKSIFINSIFNYFKYDDIDGYYNLTKSWINYNRDKNLKGVNIKRFNDHKNLLKFCSYWKHGDMFKLENLDKNNESYFLLHPMHAMHLPLEWFKTFKIKEFIGKGTKKQGKCVGPDIICTNTLNSDEIGIEITTTGRCEYSKNIKKTDKKEKILCDIYKQMTKFGDPNFEKNFFNFLNIVKDIISEKCKKSNRYKKCKELYLILVFESNRIFPYFREASEMIINNNKNFGSIFTHIFIK